MKMPGLTQCGQQPVRFAWSCIACTCRLKAASRLWSPGARQARAAMERLRSRGPSPTLNPLQRHCMHARRVLPMHDHARAAAAVGQRVGHRRRQAWRKKVDRCRLACKSLDTGGEAVHLPRPLHQRADKWTTHTKGRTRRLWQVLRGDEGDELGSVRRSSTTPFRCQSAHLSGQRIVHCLVACSGSPGQG